MTEAQALSVTRHDVERLSTFFEDHARYIPEGIRLRVSRDAPLRVVRLALQESREALNRAAHNRRESLEAVSLLNLAGGRALRRIESFRGYRRRPELDFADPPPEENTGGLAMDTWAVVCHGEIIEISICST